MFKIGFLGLGKMGSAILKGILLNNLYEKEDILFYAPSKETQEKYLNLNLSLAVDEKDLVLNSSIIILAIKPQKYLEVIDKLNGINYLDKTIISLAPGKSIMQLENWFNEARIARIMPNTSAINGESVTTVSFAKEPIKEVIDIVSSIGVYEVVDEKMIDELIPINGSMPAYLFEFVNTFVKKAKEYGIEEEKARKLVLNSIIGSARLALNSDKDINTLINDVCSKGGSTIAGLNELRNYGFNESIEKCYDACVNRSIELGKDTEVFK